MDQRDTMEGDRADGVQPDHVHKVYPKQFERDDFWAQIKRTVNGKPVSEEDIGMIVTQITDRLQLGGGGHLLDLGCGNAALAARLFGGVERYTGIDFSAYLLEIAGEFFRPGPHIDYVESDAVRFVQECEDPAGFDKVLCYGCMSYLSRGDVIGLVETLHGRFPNVTHVLFGNIPNRAKAGEFFAKRDITEFDLDDADSPIGVWWSSQDLSNVAREAGFAPEVSHMPERFYGAAYRFDLLLTRA